MTQNQKIISYMKKFGTITPRDAFIDLGIMRLGARIYDLKKMGHSIRDKFVQTQNRFGDKVQIKEYSLDG